MLAMALEAIAMRMCVFVERLVASLCTGSNGEGQCLVASSVLAELAWMYLPHANSGKQ